MRILYPIILKLQPGRKTEALSKLEPPFDCPAFLDLLAANIPAQQKTTIQYINYPRYGELIASFLPQGDGSYWVEVQDAGEWRLNIKELTGIVELEQQLEGLMGILDDVLIADGKGVILQVSPSFEETYGVKTEEVIGETVFNMVKRGVFSPSATEMVLQRREKVTIIQSAQNNRCIVVTAIPIFDKRGEISKVISYSRDITELETLKARYQEMEEQMRRYSSELDHLRQDILNIEGMVVKSEAMKKILSSVQKIALVDANVLITGETGVGKTMIAKLIHQKSARSQGPFLEINCAAIPENLLESELFGYEAGAFTGAKKSGKPGLIELSQGGTLFLDEIGEMPLTLQVKLLRVIQSKMLTKLGGFKNITVDFRLIASTNRNLEEMIENGIFREDLFYRLSVLPVYIPPLRNRREDLLALINHFLQEFNIKYGKSKELSGEALEALLQYPWLGNVRELENAIEYLVVTADGDYLANADLPQKFTPAASHGLTSLAHALEMHEMQLIRDAYQKYGSTVKVAKALGISQPTAARKIKKYCGKKTASGGF